MIIHVHHGVTKEIICYFVVSKCTLLFILFVQLFPVRDVPFSLVESCSVNLSEIKNSDRRIDKSE